jgi:hypothetical protein
VAFDKVREYLPESTPVVSQVQRQEQVALRQRHVQRRFRAF